MQQEGCWSSPGNRLRKTNPDLTEQHRCFLRCSMSLGFTSTTRIYVVIYWIWGAAEGNDWDVFYLHIYTPAINTYIYLHTYTSWSWLLLMYHAKRGLQNLACMPAAEQHLPWILLSFSLPFSVWDAHGWKGGSRFCTQSWQVILTV